jgi:chromosome segregation protein
VRQGQISELIAAKPQNRRRVLEEAAGVSGLHGRRHEAELKVAAAQANLERLDDVARELDAALAKLKREARVAARYKALGAEIRALQASLVRHRWLEARDAERLAAAQAGKAQAAMEAAVRASASAAACALEADGVVRPLREEEAAASAVAARLTIEKDRLDRDLERAADAVRRLEAELARIGADEGREAERAADAAAALARIEGEAQQVQAEIAAAPGRAPELATALETAQAARAAAEAELENVAAAVAAAEAAARAARARLSEAGGRAERAERALAAAQEEVAGLPPLPPTGQDIVQEAIAAAEAARASLERAEAAAAAARGLEAAARAASRAADDELAGATTEAAALARLATPAAGAFASAFEAMIVQPGLEAALAAALGDDLEAALDPRAPAHWGGAEAPPAPAWPKGVRPLAELVEAPAALSARLALVGLVEQGDGARLSRQLGPGVRLVSRAGDLWRWDGFTASATAPRPAQARLEQSARLRSLEARIAELEPEAAAAAQGHSAATAELETAETILRAARSELGGAEAALADTRQAGERLAREAARRETRAASLSETIARLKGEASEARNLTADLAAELTAGEADSSGADRLAGARTAAAAAREAAGAARSALERELREDEARAARRAALAAEAIAWSTRQDASTHRILELVAERQAAQATLADALAAPMEAEARIASLLDQLTVAEARKARASDAVAAAETGRTEAERDARAAEAAAAAAREARAGDLARLEGARDRLADHAHSLAETLGVAVEDLERKRSGEGDEGAVLPGGAEARLAELERERELMGAVNLRAEEEVVDLAARMTAMGAERADLAGALARLRQAIGELNSEGRDRLLAAFEVIDRHFRELFTVLFQGGQAELRLVESDDPLEAGLEVFACPPGKRLAVMSLMSGGEQAMTAVALIFAVFLANPAPVCVLDEVDAPMDDANVERFCDLLASMRAKAATRFVVITHNPLTMSRMDRLYGVTMRERGVSQLVSVDLRQAEVMAAQ